MEHRLRSTEHENQTLPLAEEIPGTRLCGRWPCPTCKSIFPIPATGEAMLFMRHTGYCSPSCYGRAVMNDPKQSAEPRKGLE